MINCLLHGKMKAVPGYVWINHNHPLHYSNYYFMCSNCDLVFLQGEGEFIEHDGSTYKGSWMFMGKEYTNKSIKDKLEKLMVLI